MNTIYLKMKLHYKFTLGLLLITALITTNVFAQSRCDEATLMVNGQEYTGTLADFNSADYYKFAISANSTPGSTISISVSSNNADPLLLISTYLDGHCSGNEVIEYQGNISVGFSPTGLIPEFNSPLTLTVQPGTLYVIEVFNERGSPENYSLQIDYDAAAITIVGPPTPPAPDEFIDANLWYKADAGVTTGATFEWANQANPASPVTGNATASQSDANNQPTYNNTSGSAQINFNPSISFDGTDDVINTGTLTNYLGDTGVANDKIASQFVVYKKLETVSGGEPIYNIDNLNYLDQQAIFLGAKTNGRMLQESRRADLATAASLNEIILVDMVATSSSTPSNQDFSLNKNGVLNQNPTIGGGYTTVNTAQDGALRFGRYQDDFGNFAIAELVVFPIRVSNSLRKEVQSYLAIKYGISLGDNQGLALYFNSSGLAVYVSNVYNNDVFGIAKDDGAGLNQTQSNSMNTGSGDGTGQSGKGNIVLSNPSSLDDGDYLMIGHDNGALTEQVTDVPADFGRFRLGREWKVQHTGDVGSMTVEFDLSGLSVTGDTAILENYRLLIDTDGDGDFATGTVTQVIPSSFGSQKLIFNNLNLPDGVVLAFSTGLDNQSWTLSKTSSTADYSSVGQTIFYTLELENTGNVDIENIQVLDPGADTIHTTTASGTPLDGILSPGEVWTYVATYLATQADIDAGSYTNIATASGTTASGNLENVSDTATINANQKHSWTMRTQSDITSFDTANTVVPIKVYLRNTGNLSISGVTLTKPEGTIGGSLNGSSDIGSDGILSPGEEWEYLVIGRPTQADLDAGVYELNFSVNGIPSGGVSDDASTKFTIDAIRKPNIALSTKSEIQCDVVSYEYKVFNTGNVTLSNIIFNNSLTATTDTIAQLAPTDSLILQANYILTDADYQSGEVSSASEVTAKAPDGAEVTNSLSNTTTVLPLDESTELTENCDSYTWNGQTYTVSGIYVDTLQNFEGCDSIATLDLTIHYGTSSTDTVIACDSYDWGGQSYTTSGTYIQHQLTNAEGCDSVATLVLTILNSTSSVTTVDTCDSYTWTDGNTYTSSGIYYDTLQNSVGCDSVKMLDLTIKETNYSDLYIAECDSYTGPDGKEYTKKGKYEIVIPNAAGCDSVITLHLTILETGITIVDTTACDSFLTHNGTSITQSGVYSETHTTPSGCQGEVQYNVTILNSTTSTKTITACDSYTWTDGKTYTTSGFYTQTLTNSVGCDSIAMLDLSILNSTTSTTIVDACENYTWTDGNTYSTSGIYADTLQNAAGCDSVAVLNLTIRKSSSSTTTITACNSYDWTDGNRYSTTGIYTQLLTNAVGCDSVATLDLTILNSTSSVTTVDTCDSYAWTDGNTYISTGTYYDTLQNSLGCDSVAMLDLTIRETTYSNLYIAECDSYTGADGNEYTKKGKYEIVIANAAGCDSVITLHLTILDVGITIVDTTACDSFVTHNGTVFMQSGVYSEMHTSLSGCQREIQYNVTVLNGSSSLTTIAECDQYTWTDGNTYTASGVYTQVLTNAAGCDSVATLDLTILKSTHSNEKITACESYTWTDGKSYGQSGIYEQVLTNAAGCDSIVQLELTITGESNSDLYITECDSYTGPDGVEYTKKGKYKITITNSAGCDSVITLHLMLLETGITIIDTTVCDSFISLNGTEFTQSGVYSEMHTTSSGCEREIQYNLTVNRNSPTIINEIAVDSYTWTNGKTYTRSGTYVQTLTDSNGCDSTIVLNLTIELVNNCAPVLVNPIGDTTFYVSISDQSIELGLENGAIFEACIEGYLGTYDIYQENSSDLPLWMTVNQNDSTYAIQGNPTAADTGCVNIIVAYTNAYGTATDTFMVCNELGTGAHELELAAFDISMYPNPTKGAVTIEIDSPVLGDLEVMVHSMNGQEILRKQYLSTDRVNFNLSERVSGMYLVTIRSNDRTVVKKLILDRK